MSLPKKAKRVFKGIIFDVYQWRQKMFDGGFKTFESIKRQDTVIVIPTIRNKIIAIRQQQPGTGWFVSTPSGRMDVPRETPKQTALRELLEETGMKPGKFILWKVIKREGKEISNIYFFIARDCQVVTGQKLDSGEKIKILPLNFEQYLAISKKPTRHMEESLIDMFRARLDKKYKNYLKKIIFG
jgi:ADP-ribose pyrophosphatase